MDYAFLGVMIVTIAIVVAIAVYKVREEM